MPLIFLIGLGSLLTGYGAGYFHYREAAAKRRTSQDGSES
jgi:hypothetical protein